GKSGCGKSTLLRILSGLERTDSGHVLQSNDEVIGINKHARMMFQDPRLLPWLTVKENIAIGLHEENNQAEKSAWALSEVGLAERENEWPSVLSGGQQQRVALARALATDPSLLLLDEPLGALDALTRYEMQSLIENLWMKNEWTTVLVTHDVAEAVMLADRVILLEDGYVAMDLDIPLARPRVATDKRFIELQNTLLNRLITTNEKITTDEHIQ